jgi:dTMP kinase
MLVALEGIDACGKSTLASLLSEALGMRILKFPDYTTSTGERILALLQQGGGDPYTLQALMNANKIEKMPRLRRENLILDRYMDSAIVYGMADGVPWEWMHAQIAVLPQPLISFLLAIPVEESFRRRPGRMDTYEANHSRLLKVLTHYRWLYGDHFQRLHGQPLPAPNPYRMCLDGTQPSDVLCKQIVNVVDAL